MTKHIQCFWFAKDVLLDLPQEDDIGIFKYIANAQNKYLNAKKYVNYEDIFRY
jgi:hypothetical protein